MMKSILSGGAASERLTSLMEALEQGQRRTEALVQAATRALEGLSGGQPGDSPDTKALLAETLREQLLTAPRHAEPGRLPRHEFKAFSQAGEDGIIHEIFNRIGTADRRFVEIGCGDGRENNSLHLLAQGWTGMWIEGDPANALAIRETLAPQLADGRLALHAGYVTPENVDGLLRDAGFSGEIDLFSLDIDGNDHHVMAAMAALRPRVAVLEYNARFGPSAEWVMPADPGHGWDGTDYFGVSLKSLEKLMRARGMALVGCNLLGSNAFFVRADLADEATFRAPFTAENHFEPARYNALIHAYRSGHPVSRKTVATLGRSQG